MNKITWIITGIGGTLFLLLATSVVLLYVQFDKSNERQVVVLAELQDKQASDLQLVTTSFRELQSGLQIENSELERSLEKQEQQFLTQIQEIERKKQLSEQLLSNNNKDLATNLDALSDKLIELEGTSKSALITKWSDATVKLRCYFSDGSRSSGSGFYVGPESELSFGAGNDHVILTNSHVLEENDLIPDSCEFTWNNGTTVEVEVSKEEQTISYFEDFDAGFVTLSPSQIPTSIRNSTNVYDVCDIRPTSGDDLLILGYPKIGSSAGITSTEGIVSAYEAGFYITSAKISKGNSGGVAIDTQSDCFIGIPTLVRADEVESLGRILDIQTLFE